MDKLIKDDDPVGEIYQIVRDNLGSPIDYQPLIMDLVRFVVKRDLKVHEHAIKLGMELGVKANVEKA